MTMILLARHGETDWNREGRWQGHTDRPLNDAGRAQARALGARTWPGSGIDLLYSSDLARARETAAAVEAATGLEAVDRPGAARGGRRRVGRRHPQAEAQGARSRLVPAVARRGDRRLSGGETYLELHRRSVRAFHRILDAADGRTAVVVCHGGNIRAIVSEVVGLSADERWRVAGATNCSLTAIERRHGRVTLVTFNETGHLD